MAITSADVIGGVDTHKHVHHAAVIDTAGALIETKAFPSHGAGNAELYRWFMSHGPISAVGIEGTGSCGA